MEKITLHIVEVIDVILMVQDLFGVMLKINLSVDAAGYPDFQKISLKDIKQLKWK